MPNTPRGYPVPASTDVVSLDAVQNLADAIDTDVASVEQLALNTGRAIPAMHGASISPWRAPLADTVAQVEELGSNTVTFSIRASSTLTGSTVTIAASEWVWGDPAYNALAPGRRMILEPYPWLDDGAGLETEWDPADVNLWFTEWQAAILELAGHYPTAWGIYIGSNLVHLEGYHAKWLALISAVRAAHPNMQILMRTNWWYTAAEDPSSFTVYNAKLANPVFDAVDMLAIAWYFELCDTASPDLDELTDVLLRGTTIAHGVLPRDQQIITQVAALSNAHGGVPIYAGELAVARMPHGARMPWSNQTGVAYPDDERDRQMQRRYVQAWMETVGTQPWCAGYSLYSVGYLHPGDNEYTLDPNARRYLAACAAAV